MAETSRIGRAWYTWCSAAALIALVIGCGDPGAHDAEIVSETVAQESHETTETTLGARQAAWPRSNAKDKFRRNPLDKSHDRHVIDPNDDSEEDEDPRLFRNRLTH